MTRILIAEDEARITAFLEKGLRANGFSTLVAETGPLAAEMARDADFDLVILDLGLPEMDGHRVLRTVRCRGERLPVIILTARVGVDDTVTGFESGADDYITKPYSPKELRARIRARLRRPGGPAGEAPVRFGDCELDVTRAELRRAGKVVATTPLELKLLSLLARRPGRVLTRRTLIDDVWGHDTAITERVVDNQITHLRQKIEPSPAAPRFLKSVRGIGYRFDLDDVTES